MLTMNARTDIFTRSLRTVSLIVAIGAGIAVVHAGHAGDRPGFPTHVGNDSVTGSNDDINGFKASDFYGEKRVWGNEGEFSGNEDERTAEQTRPHRQTSSASTVESRAASTAPAPDAGEPFEYITSVKRDTTLPPPENRPQAATTSATSSTGRNHAVTLTELTGTIGSVDHVDVPGPAGGNAGFTIACINLADGTHAVVSLGHAGRGAPVLVRAEDKVVLLGWRGEVEGRTIFVARRMRVGNRTLDASPVLPTETAVAESK